MTYSTDELDESKLVMGSRDDFAVLFDRYGKVLHRYCARRVGLQMADDIVAETFLIAYEKRHRFDPSYTRALPWLYGIATNQVRRCKRVEIKAYRTLEATGQDPLATTTGDDPADTASSRVDAGVSMRKLAGVLAKLSPSYRDVLLLFAWEQLSYEEIASALDVSLGTVRSRLNRARTKVRDALATAGGDFDVLGQNVRPLRALQSSLQEI